MTLAASLRAYIDYPDEDLADLSEAETAAELSAVKAELDALADSHRYGRAVSEGVRTVLVRADEHGQELAAEPAARLRAGARLGRGGHHARRRQRAGGRLRHSAAAGGHRRLRAGAGEVERAGIRKSIEQLEQAELVLAVFDLSQPLTDEDYALADRIRALGKAAQTIAVFNKLDLAAQAAPPALFETQVCLSARTGAGREALENAVGALYGGWSRIWTALSPPRGRRPRFGAPPRRWTARCARWATARPTRPAPSWTRPSPRWASWTAGA